MEWLDGVLAPAKNRMTQLLIHSPYTPLQWDKENQKKVKLVVSDENTLIIEMK